MNNQYRGPNLSALSRASETARTAIAEKCIKGMVRPDDDPTQYAWGQYLEIRGRSVQRPLGNQYGIYGTAAAIQILAMQSVDGYPELLRSGSCVLPLLIRNSDSSYYRFHEHFTNKCDLIVAFKLASLLDAATVLEPISRPDDFAIDKSALVERLLALRLPRAGWPDYQSDGEWQGPNTHATAVALLALSKGTVTVDAQRACHEALAWFCDQPLEKQSIATLSMTVIALVNLTQAASPSSDLRTPKIDRLREQCEALVANWIRGNAPDEVQRSLEGTEYWLPPGSTTKQRVGGAHFTFLLYLPHILAGLAVLASPRLRVKYSARQFTLGIIDRVTSEINSQGCFIAAGRSMVSTVEHLWLYRLLHEFEKEQLYSNKLVPILDNIRRFVRRRWPIPALALVLAAGLGVASVLTKGTLQVAFGSISATVLAVVATVVTTLLISSWGR